LGRPRKPAAQHELEGTYRADRHAEVALPVMNTMATEPSERIPAGVQDDYRMAARQLADIGIVIPLDQPDFEIAFTFLNDFRDYSIMKDRIKEYIDNATDDDTLDAIKSLVSINTMVVKAATMFHSIMSDFGATPSARAKMLHMIPKKKDETQKKSINAILARKK